jgi:hypothetical protein
MSQSNEAIDKLNRIQKLWTELGRTKANDPKCEKLMKQIRALSLEYQALAKGKKSKG